MPIKFYTDDEYRALEEREKSLTCLATTLERTLARLHLGERKYTDEEPQFGCHPFQLADFLTLLFKARRVLELIHGADGARSVKVLDVGCGIGTKVYLAGLYFESHGIENDARVAEVARNFVAELPQCQVFVDDALTFANYARYDAIYYYRPLRSESLEEQMEEKIYAEAREGCVVLPMYPALEPPVEYFVPVIASQMYVKTQNAELSQRLVAEFAT
jgi:SAM-dependent methyltransferase